MVFRHRSRLMLLPPLLLDRVRNLHEFHTLIMNCLLHLRVRIISREQKKKYHEIKSRQQKKMNKKTTNGSANSKYSNVKT